MKNAPKNDGILQQKKNPIFVVKDDASYSRVKDKNPHHIYQKPLLNLNKAAA